MNCLSSLRSHSRHRASVTNIFLNWYEANSSERISQSCSVIKLGYFATDHLGSATECLISCKNVYYKCKEANHGDSKNIISTAQLKDIKVD